MLENLDEAAGPSQKAPAFRASRLRQLVARVLTRAEALQADAPGLAEDERVLKLVGLAIKLEAELKAMRTSHKAKFDLGGKKRKDHDEAMRQTLAQRIKGLESRKPRAKPKPK